MSDSAFSQYDYRRELVPRRSAGPEGRRVGQLSILDGPWVADRWTVVLDTGGPPRGMVDECSVGECETPRHRLPAEAALCHGHYWRSKRDGHHDLGERDLHKHTPIVPKLNVDPPRHFDFTQLPELVAEEIRYVVGIKISSGSWTQTPELRVALENLALLVASTKVTTLTARTRDEWFELARSHSGIKQGRFERAGRYYFGTFFTVLQRGLVVDPWAEDDWLWKNMFDRILGMENKPTKSNLNWSTIEIDWLREPLKRYARECLQAGTRKWNTLHTWNTGFARLSAFLAFAALDTPADLDRTAFLRYIEFDRASGRTNDAVLRHANTLASVLTTLKIDGFIPELGSEVYLRNGEAPMPAKLNPRPFPQDILTQVDERIVDNPKVDRQLRLMIEYCRWAGPRAGELISLPIDCIRENGAGGHWIEYSTEKTDTVRRFPLPNDLGLAMVEQRKRVMEAFGPGAEHMFPQPKSSNTSTGTTRPWSQTGFYKRMRWLFEEVGISQSSITGEIVRGSEIHRFRHSIGTALLNNGWTQREVKDFFGHSSETMTAHYARITDDTLNAKADAFHRQQAKERKERGELTQSDPVVERLRSRVVAVLVHGNCMLPGHLSCSIRDDDPCSGCAFFDKGGEENEATNASYRTRLNFTIKQASASDDPRDAKIVDINQRRLEIFNAAVPEKEIDE